MRGRIGPVLTPHRHHIGVHRRRDVLHFLGADIRELHRQLVGNLFVHRARDADAADLGEALEACRDIDAIAEEIAVPLDDIADGDADAKRHLPARRIRHVPGAQAFLDVDRTAHGFDCARKFGEDGVTCGVEDPAAALGDEIVGHLTIGRQPAQRLLFVLGNQSAVAGNIGRKNCRDLAFHENSLGQKYAPAECRQNFPGATIAVSSVVGARSQPESAKKRPSRCDGR